MQIQMKTQIKVATVVAMSLGLGPAAQAALLLYEPFNYASGGTPVALNGQGAASNGMSSTWSTYSPSASAVTVYNQGVSSGVNLNTGLANPYVGTVTNITTSGGYFGPAPSLTGGTTVTTDHIYASRPLATGFASNFIAGSTTWFSFVSVRSYNANAASPKFAIGASDFIATKNRGQTAGGEAIGMGGGLGLNLGSNTQKVFAQFWDESTPGNNSFQNYDPTGLQSVNSNATVPVTAADSFTWNTTDGTANIIIGKIVWHNGSPDVISVARFLQADGTLTESMFDAAAKSSAGWTEQRDLDQSQFDTISITGARYFADELRIATTFSDVINGTTVVPETSTALLLPLGLAAFLLRRRS